MSFSLNSFQLKCIARVHDIYDESAEKMVEEEVPNVNVLASGTSSHGMNSYQAYDQPQDGELSDQNGLYLTHQKGKQNLHLFSFSQLSLRFHNESISRVIRWWYTIACTARCILFPCSFIRHGNP